MKSYSKVIGGILLVAGTTIGAGMLALPVSTGLAGFFPSLILLVSCWAFMTYTAFLMLEVNLSMPENSNLISMARRMLGKGGEIVSWITYLFLLYALTTAYVAGSGPIMVNIIHAITGVTIPPLAGSIPLLLLFGLFVYRGTASVDHVNRLLMFGLIIAYGAMAVMITPYIGSPLLFRTDWPLFLVAVSLVVTSFGYHIIIPSLTTYLNRDVRSLKKAILIGSLIPLAIYVLWEVLILGIIPVEGVNGLMQGYLCGVDGVQLLCNLMGENAIGITATLFSLFAIITSFLGVSLSLTDFLADGLKIKKSPSGRALLYALTFLPPIAFTLLDPRAFFSALEYAGAFGVIVLLGLMPALMVWCKRYYHHFESTYKAPGGKFMLLMVMLISLLVIGLEVANKLQLMKLIDR